MANINAPIGVRPIMRCIAGGPGFASTAAHKTVGVATALFIHDVVTLAGSGTKEYPAIKPAATGDPFYGVNLIYGAANAATDHLIVLGDKQQFTTQIDNVTNAQLTMNAALVAGAGNMLNQYSGHSANGAAVTNTLGFKLMGLEHVVGNTVGPYARVIVMFNRSQLADQTAGV